MDPSGNEPDSSSEPEIPEPTPETVVTPPPRGAGTPGTVSTPPPGGAGTPGTVSTPPPSGGVAETLVVGPPAPAATPPTVLTPPPGGASAGPGAPHEAAQQIGRYAVVRELARGGMGVVYVARDTQLGREVALKIMRAGATATEEERERFQIEARAAARLKHPNIVGIHDVGEHQGQPYFAMAFVNGESLQRRIERDGPLPLREAARLTERLAEALFYAHSQAILHRDMKPDNVLINASGEPLITDFGLAKDVDRKDEGLTKSGQMMGTPGYMPPEQAAGRLDQVDRRADVYSLGGTLYAMLTGRPPFAGDTLVNTLTLVLTTDPAPPRSLRPDLDRDLETICLKALEKEPELRYASARDLALDLGRYLRSETILARPPTLGDRVRKWARRNRGTARAVTAVGALALAIGVAVTAVFVNRLQAETRRAQANEDLATQNAAEAEAQRDLAAKNAAEAEAQRDLATQRLAEVQLRIGDAQVEKARAAAERFQWRDAAALLGAALAQEDRPERRGRLLRAVSAIPTLHELSGHEATVLAVAFSPSGARLASADSRGAVRVWDTASLATVCTFTVAKVLRRGLSWAPDGERLACVVGMGVEVWSASGERLATLAGHESNVQCLSWSPDGALIALGSRKPSVSIWDAASGERRAALARFKGRVEALAWSPDSSLLACGSNLGELRLASRASAWAETPLDTGTHAEINELAFSHDGAELASAVSDYTTRIWDPASGEQLATLGGHSLGVRSVAWTPDGALITGSLDGTGRLWARSMRSKRRYAQTATLTGHLDVERVAVAAHGGRVATLGRGRARIWDRHGALRGEVVLRGPVNPEPVVAWSPTGSLLAAASRKQGDLAVLLWDTREAPNLVLHQGEGQVGRVHWLGGDRLLTRSASLQVWRSDGAPLKTLRYEPPLYRPQIDVAPDGSRAVIRTGVGADLYTPEGVRVAQVARVQRDGESVAFAPGGDVAFATPPHAAQIYARDGSLRAELSGHTGAVLWLAYSADGQSLATASKDTTVRLWDARTGASLRVLEGLADEACLVAWSPEADRVAALSWKGQLVLWDPTTGAVLADVADAGRALAWSPDGTRLATGSGSPGKRAQIFDAEGAPLAALSVSVERLAWSPDGARLAILSTNGGALLWDGVAEAALWSEEHVGDLAWAPRGAVLLTSRNHGRRSNHSPTCEDHSVLLVDGERGRVLAELPGHTGDVECVCWSPSGDWFATASADGTARLWDARLALSPAALQELAAQRSERVVDVLSVRPREVEEAR